MTLQEIREKKFPRAFKGYSDTEVDLFMAQVGAAFEKLEEQIKLSREQADALRTRLAEYEGMDREMRGALLAAQKAARDIVEEARNKEKALLEEAKASLMTIEEDIEKQRGQSEFLKQQAFQEIDELKAKAREEYEAQKKQANEEIETQTRALRDQHAREKEALEREIGELVSARDAIRSEIETLLKENIAALSARLQSLPGSEQSVEATAEEPQEAEAREAEAREAEAQEAEAPEEKAREPEPEPQEETRPKAPAESKKEPGVGFAPYSPNDIPGANAPDELPKLDFQG